MDIQQHNNEFAFITSQVVETEPLQEIARRADLYAWNTPGVQQEYKHIMEDADYNAEKLNQRQLKTMYVIASADLPEGTPDLSTYYVMELLYIYQAMFDMNEPED